MHLNVLMIDDDEIDRECFKRYLNKSSKWELDIIEAATSEEALECCRKQLPDAILVDYNLPGENGLNFYERLKSSIADNQSVDDIAVIFLTGQGNEDLVVEVMKHGAKDYLIKSKITQEYLIQALNNALEKTKLLHELKEKNQRLEKLARYDSLTGMLNRQSFEDALDSALAQSRRHDRILGLYLSI